MELWYPKALVRHGPPNKVGYPTHAPTDTYGHKLGIVYHSSEGSRASWLGVLDSQVRPRRSATFFNPKVGRLLQHYRADVHTWANGLKAANINYASCENEGMAGEPLTVSQVDNLVGLTVWYYQQFGWTELSRHTTLREHNDFVPTACPSNRIPWVPISARARQLLTEEGEDELSSREYEELKAAIKVERDRTTWVAKIVVGINAAVDFGFVIIRELVKRTGGPGVQ